MMNAQFKTIEECKEDARRELADATTEELREIVRNNAYHRYFRQIAEELLQKREVGQ